MSDTREETQWWNPLISVCGEKDDADFSIFDHDLDFQYTVDFSDDGSVMVYLSWEELDAIGELPEKLNVGPDQWIESASWSVTLDTLVTQYIGHFMAGDTLKIDPEERAGCERIASALEQAAQRLRAYL